MIPEREVTVSVSDGTRLGAYLAAPADPEGGVVICHPHPLYGGDMDNPVVIRAAEVCSGLELVTLRFNFRGVGRSTGAHDGGPGERRDVEAALDHVAGSLPRASPVAVVGYSFGAVIAAEVAAAGRSLAGLCLIAPPMELSGAKIPLESLATFGRPLFVIGGTADRYCSPGALEQLARALPAATITVIDGASHFFLGKLFPLGGAVGQWARATFPLRSREPGGSRGAC
jgi:alpha/beta superfamily hydrolase